VVSGGRGDHDAGLPAQLAHYRRDDAGGAAFEREATTMSTAGRAAGRPVLQPATAATGAAPARLDCRPDVVAAGAADQRAAPGPNGASLGTAASSRPASRPSSRAPAASPLCCEPREIDPVRLPELAPAQQQLRGRSPSSSTGLGNTRR